MASHTKPGHTRLNGVIEPARPAEAAAYLIEMLRSMADLAHDCDLPNSGLMLATAARVVDQERRLMGAAPSGPRRSRPESELTRGQSEPASPE